MTASWRLATMKAPFDPGVPPSAAVRRRSAAIDTRTTTLTCLFCGAGTEREDAPCPACGCLRPGGRGRAMPLTGRTQEVTWLQGHIDRVVDGQGGIAGVTGPAGIGKTRLAAEALAYAKQRGCYDFPIRGFEPSAGVPYWTLIEALRYDAGTGSPANRPPGVDQFIDALQSARESPQDSTAGFEVRHAGVNARVYDALTAVLRA
ncbi:MAG: ATP-binding protein [Dehalococcoidia bacterium]